MARANNSVYLGPLLICAVIYFIYSRIKAGSGLFGSFFGTPEDQANQNVTEDVIQDIPVNLQVATMSAQQGVILAERLQKCMNPISGFSPDYDGTDEQGILNVFALIKNSDDAKLVYKGFGLRAYTKNWFLDNQRLDLIAWLQRELSTSVLNKISAKVKWMVYE